MRHTGPLALEDCPCSAAHECADRGHGHMIWGCMLTECCLLGGGAGSLHADPGTYVGFSTCFNDVYLP